MPKLILSIEIDERMAEFIETDRVFFKEGKTTYGKGYFNEDGRIALDEAELERDSYDDSFFLFTYEGIM